MELSQRIMFFTWIYPSERKSGHCISYNLISEGPTEFRGPSLPCPPLPGSWSGGILSFIFSVLVRQGWTVKRIKSPEVSGAVGRNFDVCGARMLCPILYVGSAAEHYLPTQLLEGRILKPFWAIDFQSDYWPVNYTPLMRIRGENSFWNVNHVCQPLSKTWNVAFTAKIASIWPPVETPISGKAVKTAPVLYLYIKTCTDISHCKMFNCLTSQLLKD